MGFSACRKAPIAGSEPCLQQTDNPDHRSYSSNDISEIKFPGKHCGLIPLSVNHYWIYLDSIFDNGIFIRTKYDTLRFTKAYQTHSDGLVWWEANKLIGLPEKI